jgi:putative cell wall-binding protein
MRVSKKLITLGLSLAIASSYIPTSNALDSVQKIQGIDRYETAGLIADKQTYKTAILVNSDKSLADGLSASGLAGSVDAPILLTKRDSIPDATKNRLESVEKIYIIGGENSIGNKVQSELESKGIEIKRISGEGRIETSYSVAEEIKSITNGFNKVIFTNAYKGEPDAMSASAVALRDKSPIILTDGKSTSFDGLGAESYVIGGSSSISNVLVNNTKSKRIGGTDRFDTNKKIIQEFYGSASEFYITKAYNLVDALTGSTIAKNTPIVLVHNGSNKSILKNASKITTLGGLDEVIVNESLNVTNGVGDPNTGVRNVLAESMDIVERWFKAEKVYHYDEIKNINVNDIKGELAFMYPYSINYKGGSYYTFSAICYKNKEIQPALCIKRDDISKFIIIEKDNTVKEIVSVETAKKLVAEKFEEKYGFKANKVRFDSFSGYGDQNYITGGDGDKVRGKYYYNFSPLYYVNDKYVDGDTFSVNIFTGGTTYAGEFK